MNKLKKDSLFNTFIGTVVSYGKVNSDTLLTLYIKKNLHGLKI